MFVLRYPKLKIVPLVPCPQLPLDGIASGIFPYLGGSVRVDQLRSVAMAYESVIVPGRQGAKLAAKIPGVLIGYRARGQIKNSAGTQTGSGLATAVIILGWIGITILVAGVILIAFHPNKPQ